MEDIFIKLKKMYADISSRFKQADTSVRLIYVNSALFLLMLLINVFAHLFNANNPISEFLYMPANIWAYLIQPWSILTYMFMHGSLMHLFFNMLWLYWFGRFFVTLFSEKQLFALYLLGGIGGGLIYMLAFNLFPFFENVLNQAYLLGASASILAIVIAVTIKIPNTKVNLFLLGPVSLKTIAIITVLIDIFNVTSSNAGGHFAHIGGMIIGALFAMREKIGFDIIAPLIRFFDWCVGLNFFEKRPPMKVTYQDVVREKDEAYNQRRKAQKKAVDHILDKVKQSGYDSLTEEEKKELFNAKR